MLLSIVIISRFQITDREWRNFLRRQWAHQDEDEDNARSEEFDYD